MAAGSGQVEHMAHLNKVVRSINALGEQRCVDIVQDPEGRFGYAEYRRDPEETHGWYPAGMSEAPIYETQEEAEAAARRAVAWLTEAE
ncbi:MAG: hypothetical protein AB3N13_16355 [Arenibacterium sp.]